MGCSEFSYVNGEWDMRMILEKEILSCCTSATSSDINKKYFLWYLMFLRDLLDSSAISDNLIT